MGLLSGLAGMMGEQGGDPSAMLGLLPMLMQQQLDQGGLNPNGLPPIMPPTSNPRGGLGGAAPMPPVMNPGGGIGGGLPGAFSDNPQFQQQLQAMMNQQSPGYQMPQFTPPARQMSMSPVGGSQGMGGGGGVLNPMSRFMQRY